MSIYGSAVRRPITTMMIFVGLLVLGVFSLNRLPVDFYPEIEFPAISVLTTYSGASAADIETNVTRMIEDNLNTVSNVKDISSQSLDNMSIVVCEFEWGTNLDEASNEMRDAISFAEQFLPEEVDKPALFKFSSSMMPVMFFAVTAGESYPAIANILDEKLVNRLNRIEGIGSIGLIGAPGREVQVNIDPRKMESYGLSVEMVAAVLNSENLNLPAGNLEMGMMDYPLRIQGEFPSSDVIGDIVLASFAGQTVYLNDIATIKDTIKEMRMDERINGKTGMRMIIQKQSGANTVQVCEDVREMMEELVKTLPEDIEVNTFYDSSKYINDSINNLSRTLMFAAIAVILVVLFFLGRWRATFIVILTIPVALVTSFIYLLVSGGTINIIALSSLSIAIGMVVDDAIVVLENVAKHIERGAKPREAAIYATNEVWLAVIVTTAVVVAVFLPLTMVGGITGEMFRPLGFIVTITVVTSTLAAITLTPMLSSKLMRLRNKPVRTRTFSYDGTVGRLLDRLDRFYENSLRGALKIRLVTVLIAVLILVASFMLAPRMGFEFMPQADEGSMTAAIELQTGIRTDESIRIARKIDAYVEENLPEVQFYNTSTGANDEGGMMSLFTPSGTHRINYMMILKDLEDRTRSVEEVSDQLRQYLETIPEIITYEVVPNGGMGGGMGGNTVDIEIYGFDFETTSGLAEELADRLESVPGATNITVSRDPVKPELQIVPDREKMAQHGLNTFSVANAVRNRVEGPYMSRYREEGDEYDIVVRFIEEERNSISNIEDIALLNNQNHSIRLGEVTDIEEYWSPPNIERKNKERIVTVSTTPYKVPLNMIAMQVQAIIDDLDVPPEVLIQMSGSVQDMQDSMKDLMLLLLLSVVLVFLVMSSQFESFRTPLIIMVSILFAFPGVILAHLVTGTTMSVISMVGGVMLVGIVVKNAIVLVDYINLTRDRGIDLSEAIVSSGKSRLRPVLMTSLTTILGMLPLALSTGSGSEIWSPMGIAVIGGLVFSTFVTLIIVPVTYDLFNRRRSRRVKKDHYDFLNEFDPEALAENSGNGRTDN